MIKCLAIDDEPLALRQLSTYIERVPFLELVAQCQSANSARKAMESEKIDAIFIDINMPDLNGMDFVRLMKNPPITVFTTAYSDYAVDAYKVDATDYLLKPFTFEEFDAAARRVKRRYDLLRLANGSRNGGETDDSLYFKTEHRTVRVRISDITYVEGMSEYLKIHLRNDKPLVVLYTMKRLEEQLPCSRFMRIHRSYIINLSEVKMVGKGRVLLDEGIELPISDMYRDAFNAYICGKRAGT